MSVCYFVSICDATWRTALRVLNDEKVRLLGSSYFEPILTCGTCRQGIVVRLRSLLYGTIFCVQAHGASLERYQAVWCSKQPVAAFTRTRGSQPPPRAEVHTWAFFNVTIFSQDPADLEGKSDPEDDSVEDTDDIDFSSDEETDEDSFTTAPPITGARGGKRLNLSHRGA